MSDCLYGYLCQTCTPVFWCLCVRVAGTCFELMRGVLIWKCVCKPSYYRDHPAPVVVSYSGCEGPGEGGHYQCGVSLHCATFH